MRFWLDTEFTTLAEPELISLGLVADDGLSECYVEFATPDLLQRCGDFARANVLPLFGRRGARACSDVDLAHRVTDFLAMTSAGEPIELLYDYTADRTLLLRALANAPQWRVLEPRTTWRYIAMEVEWSDVAPAAMAAVFTAAHAEGLDRHHALVDARALRAGYLAAEADS